MEARKLIDTLVLAEKLKDTMRHCYTANGRRESVAEHCWMASLMAYFMKDEFPDVDMDKVIRMILIHDLGECFTGDIPVFNKTAEHENKEKELLYSWVKTLPQNLSDEMIELYEEMEKLETMEARIFKAIDGMEAVLQHNISDISTWLPNEYELNQTYATDKVAFSEYLKKVREELRKDTVKKISREELIDSESTEPCPYYEVDGNEVDKSVFEEQLRELVIDKRLERSAWIGI